jgi:hypothetical protein
MWKLRSYVIYYALVISFWVIILPSIFQSQPGLLKPRANNTPWNYSVIPFWKEAMGVSSFINPQPVLLNITQFNGSMDYSVRFHNITIDYYANFKHFSCIVRVPRYGISLIGGDSMNVIPNKTMLAIIKESAQDQICGGFLNSI